MKRNSMKQTDFQDNFFFYLKKRFKISERKCTRDIYRSCMYSYITFKRSISSYKLQRIPVNFFLVLLPS